MNDILNDSKAGVTIGDPVLRTGKPLSVELGPGKACILCLLPIQLLCFLVYVHVPV